MRCIVVVATLLIAARLSVIADAQVTACAECCRFDICEKAAGNGLGRCCGVVGNNSYCCAQDQFIRCAASEEQGFVCEKIGTSISSTNIIIIIIGIVILLIAAYFVYDWYRKNKATFEDTVNAITAAEEPATESGGHQEAKDVLQKPLKELGWDHLELDQKTGFFVLNQAAPSPNDQLPSTLRKLGTQVQSAPRVKH